MMMMDGDVGYKKLPSKLGRRRPFPPMMGRGREPRDMPSGKSVPLRKKVPAGMMK